MQGILNVYKDIGMTSFDVIAKLRKILNEKRIGHTGTLDPNATGVLPICIGNDTKLVQYILNEKKQYIAKIKLGIKTNTGDITGNVIEQKDVTEITQLDLDNVKRTFVGKIYQIPPMYSAIKVNGRKLYELAREGKEIAREKRLIEIYDISTLIYDKNNQVLSMVVDCSKGTYIRTLAEDISVFLGNIGTLIFLERTRNGVFLKENSYSLADIEKHMNNNSIKDIFCDVEHIFSSYQSIDIEAERLHYYINGVKISIEAHNGIFKVYCNNSFTGLGEVKNGLLKRKYVIEQYISQ